MFSKKTAGNLVITLLVGALTWQVSVASDNAQPRPVGTWALSLDAGPYGLPGFALNGVATFHGDGTIMVVDAGDFGSLGTLDTAQLGAWQRTSSGVVARTLILSADPATGEPLMWQRVTFTLHRGVNDDHMIGAIRGETLSCTPIVPLPGAINCPNPVTDGAEFTPFGPQDVPVEFHRHNAAD